LGNPRKATIYLDVKVPINQQLRYMPGILETLKFAWI